MKKYFEKFKNLKNTNKKLYYATICLFVLTGFTFAYVIDQISGGAISKVFITADTADNLQFEVDKDILIKPTQFNFEQGGADLTDTATATARLKANSTNNTASYTYNVYFQITTNEYIYTTEDHKSEMLLQVTNPNGENLTELDGLTYNETLQGFDITNLVDFLVIAENYEIASNSSTTFTEQNWTITVKFINLDTNQVDNEGKTLEGKVLIQKDKKSVGDINIAISNLPEVYGLSAELNCDGSEGTYNQKYGRIEISSLNAYKSFCNLNFTERTEKQYLNDYIIGLDGTTQGNGKVIHETFNSPDYTNSSFLTNSDYSSVSQFISGYHSESTGTAVTDAFSYSDGEWISNISNMDSDKYYNLSFSIPGGKNYQLCYDLSTGSSNNDLVIYYNSKLMPIGTINNIYYVSANDNNPKNGCIYFDGLSENNNFRITLRTFTEIATLKISIKQSNSIKSNIDTGYRYEGKNPNNYIWFNNELWRIIGVMNENSHGQSNERLVKIIKNERIIPGVTYSNYGGNNSYANSYINRLLNDAYLNNKNGTNADYCFLGGDYGTQGKKSNCNFENAGIRQMYKKMINNVTWFQGGLFLDSDDDRYYIRLNANGFYELERESNTWNNNASSSAGYIGLMYASDYAYGVLSNECPRNTAMISYDNSNCFSNNWMYLPGDEWVINNFADDNYWALKISENIHQQITANNLSIRPTLYLNKNVYIISGIGTIDDPYVIGM